MPDGISKWSPWGTGISDWLASRGQYRLAGQPSPTLPPSAPADRVGIGEWDWRLYLTLLQERNKSEEEAELDPDKKRLLIEAHRVEENYAASQIDAGVWGTAEQFGLPKLPAIYKDYNKWAAAATPELPEEYPADTKVISEGGYDFVISYDETGKELSRDALGRTETLGMNDYQKSQIALEQQQLKQQGDFQDAQLRMTELQYAVEMAGLGEEGWIERWYADQARIAQFSSPEWHKEGSRNPYAAYLKKYDPTRLEELVQKGYAPVESITEPLAQLGEPYPKPEDYTYAPPNEQVGSGNIVIKPDGEIDIPFSSGRAFTAWQQKKAETSAQETPSYEDVKGEFVTKTPKKGKARPRPTAPPTPAWLHKFAPWLTEGQPITKGQMPTPSGQLWGQTPPSVQAGLKGFT